MELRAKLFLDAFSRRGIEAEPFAGDTLLRASYEGNDLLCAPACLSGLPCVAEDMTVIDLESERIAAALERAGLRRARGGKPAARFFLSRAGFFGAMQHIEGGWRGASVEAVIKERLFAFLDALPDLPFVEIVSTYSAHNEIEVLALSVEVDIQALYEASPPLARSFTLAVVDELFPRGDECAFNDFERVKAGTPPLSELAARAKGRQPQVWAYHPVTLDIELTNRCTQRCPECGILPDIEAGEPGLPAEKIVELLGQAGDLGLHSFSLTGGEPFLRLSDMCKIIAETDLDCYKIQTNCALFKTAEDAREMLHALRESGFGSGTSLRAGLHASVGIQNYSGGVPLEHAVALARAFPLEFSPDDAVLVYLLTSRAHENRLENRNRLLRMLEIRAGDILLREHVHLHHCGVRYYGRPEQQGEMRELASIAEMIDVLAPAAECFRSTHPEIPEPRIFIRASGEAYACSNFAHVFRLGNVRESRLCDLLEQANRNPLIRIIAAGGPCALLAEAERRAPGIADARVPVNISRCHLCRMLSKAIDEVS